MRDRLNIEEEKILLDLAEEAIKCAVHGDPLPPLDLDRLPVRLREVQASFVTLLKPSGELRGCIGSIEAHSSLAHDVQRNAVSSATRDPRFLPVSPEELTDLQFELSILTPPRPLEFDGPDELLDKLHPGIDGVLIEKGWHRATLLPSVWEKISDPVSFLDMLCLKAGLPEGEWRRPGLTVSTYQAYKIRR